MVECYKIVSIIAILIGNANIGFFTSWGLVSPYMLGFLTLNDPKITVAKVNTIQYSMLVAEMVALLVLPTLIPIFGSRHGLRFTYFLAMIGFLMAIFSSSVTVFYASYLCFGITYLQGNTFANWLLCALLPDNLGFAAFQATAGTCFTPGFYNWLLGVIKTNASLDGLSIPKGLDQKKLSFLERFPPYVMPKFFIINFFIMLTLMILVPCFVTNKTKGRSRVSAYIITSILSKEDVHSLKNLKTSIFNTDNNDAVKKSIINLAFARENKIAIHSETMIQSNLIDKNESVKQKNKESEHKRSNSHKDSFADIIGEQRLELSSSHQQKRAHDSKLSSESNKMMERKDFQQSLEYDEEGSNKEKEKLLQSVFEVQTTEEHIFSWGDACKLAATRQFVFLFQASTWLLQGGYLYINYISFSSKNNLGSEKYAGMFAPAIIVSLVASKFIFGSIMDRFGVVVHITIHLLLSSLAMFLLQLWGKTIAVWFVAYFLFYMLNGSAAIFQFASTNIVYGIDKGAKMFNILGFSMTVCSILLLGLDGIIESYNFDFNAVYNLIHIANSVMWVILFFGLR